jgi:hypothetical protein
MLETESRPPVYFLLHVPKTAGQTIRRHLAGHCPPDVFWEPESGLPPGPPEGIRAVSGHDLSSALERRFPGREIRRAVLLREPVSLQLSLYNYRMMNRLAKGHGTCGLELHLRSLPRDFIAHRLLSRWLGIPWPRLLGMSDERKYALLNRTLANFWFVADYRQVDRLVTALAADLGIPAEAAPQNTAREWRRQVEWRPLAAEALPAALRNLILARNPIDRALWDSWRDAGFATRGVSPQRFAAPPRLSVLTDELARPGFVAGALWRRYRPVGRVTGIAEADRARDSGDWAHAARAYRKALAGMPNAPAVWVQYGHALKQLGELAAAEEAYRRSLLLDPETADTHLQLGRVLELQGRAEEAAAAYRQSAALGA